LLVGCCALVFWAWRVVWESSDPVLAEARAIQTRALRDLQSPQAAARLAAIRELDRLGVGDSTIAIRPLTAVLRDEDPEVRIAASEALGRIGALAVRNGSEGEGVRSAITALIALLKEPQPGVRIAAAHSLGLIISATPNHGAGPRRGVGKSGAAAPAPVPAVAIITPVETNAVMAALVETLGDQDAKVRHAALVTLAAVGPGTPLDPPRALGTTLTDESPENRVATVNVLASYQRGLDPWIPSLIRMLERDTDRSVRDSAASALRHRISQPAVTAAVVPILVAGLRSQDREVRVQLAGLLGRIAPDAGAAIPALLRVLTEPIDSEVAAFENQARDPGCNAAEALGRIAPGTESAPEVIRALTEVARSGHRFRRAWAAYALGQFGPAAASAVPVLIHMLDEDPPNMWVENKGSAAWALGQIAPETPSSGGAVTALAAALELDGDVRLAAIKALSRFGPRAAVAIPKIRALTASLDSSVRKAATSTLAALEP
jgi:HEAT repeat protein